MHGAVAKIVQKCILFFKHFVYRRVLSLLLLLPFILVLLAHASVCVCVCAVCARERLCVHVKHGRLLFCRCCCCGRYCCAVLIHMTPFSLCCNSFRCECVCARALAMLHCHFVGCHRLQTFASHCRHRQQRQLHHVHMRPNGNGEHADNMCMRAHSEPTQSYVCVCVRLWNQTNRKINSILQKTTSEQPHTHTHKGEDKDIVGWWW